MDGPCRSIPRRKRTPIYIAKGKPGAPKTVVRVSEQKDEITVNTGAIVCKLGKSGPALIRSISISGEMMAKEGRLIALKEKRSGSDTQSMYYIERFESLVKRAAIEQNGPVKTVIKIEGVHRGGGIDVWLPLPSGFLSMPVSRPSGSCTRSSSTVTQKRNGSKDSV